MVATMVLLQRAEHVFEFGTLALHGRQVLRMGFLWGIATLLVGFFEELTYPAQVRKWNDCSDCFTHFFISCFCIVSETT